MITSLHSPHIARVKALLLSHSPSERNSDRRFIIEGKRALDLAFQSNLIKIEELFFTQITESILDEIDSKRLIADRAHEVSEAVMKKMSGTVSPQGLLAIASFPAVNLADLKTKSRIAFFHEISDPGNAGTIIRSADAFGFEGVIFSSQSVDPYSAKVVRSTVGSIARVPILYGADFLEVLEFFRPTHQFIGLDMAGASIMEIDFAKPTLLLFGSEAHGLPDQIFEGKDVQRVSIPMSDGIESLNLASAATLAMYEMSRVK